MEILLAIAFLRMGVKVDVLGQSFLPRQHHLDRMVDVARTSEARLVLRMDHTVVVVQNMGMLSRFLLNMLSLADDILFIDSADPRPLTAL